MQGGFGGSAPSPPPAPKPPSPTDAAQSASGNPDPRRQGYGSTLLTSGAGVLNQGSAKKTLLGQ